MEGLSSIENHPHLIEGFITGQSRIILVGLKTLLLKTNERNYGEGLRYLWHTAVGHIKQTADIHIKLHPFQ